MKCEIFIPQEHKEIIQESMLFEFEYVINLCKIPIELKSAPQINKFILKELYTLGWSGEIKIDYRSNMTITSAKELIGLCIQTGNYSRIYADLLKLQSLYKRNAIKGGIIVLPNRAAAKILAANISNGYRLRKELNIFSKIIDLPLVIIEFGEN